MQASPRAKHLCQITLLGNLVAKPEIRYSTNPVLATTDITIATHSKWLDKKTNTQKEWTDFHPIKAIGEVCEQGLSSAEKGDLLLIKGTLIDQPKSDSQFVMASFIQAYPKGYAPSINHLNISGRLSSDIKLVSTQKNKVMAELELVSDHSVFSHAKETLVQQTITRTIHVWGKTAEHLQQTANIDDELIIDGKLSYLNNKNKHQLIDAHQVIQVSS